MRISAKGRYALAAAMSLARQYGTGEYITVIRIAERLGISKIYLEQVFSLLKRGEIVVSIKGSQGGYQLSREPESITAWDILSAVELPLFEPAEDTVLEKAPDFETALRTTVWEALDEAVSKTLQRTTLQDLLAEADRYNENYAPMFYI